MWRNQRPIRRKWIRHIRFRSGTCLALCCALLSGFGNLAELSAVDATVAATIRSSAPMRPDVAPARLAADVQVSAAAIESTWAESWENARVSHGFREKMRHVVGTLPRNVQAGLARRGWRVELAEFVVDAAPDLRGQKPRGWPDGATWENAEAVHLPGNRLLILAEKRRSRSGKYVDNRRAEGTFRHELGHAFDMANSGDADFLSSSPEFIRTIDRDRGQLSAELRSQMHYYLQASQAGRQETLAEAFAITLGGGSDVEKQHHFIRAFPDTLQFVEKSIRNFER